MTYDLMRPSVEQFLYLKCPHKIRAAVINAGGKPVSVKEIEARLPRVRVREEVDEPEPMKPRKFVLTREERARIAAIAARIPDKKPVIDVELREPKTLGKDLVRFVMREMMIPTNEFFCGSREGHVRAAAAMVAVLLRAHNPERYSYPKIARILRVKCHTTVMHAVRRWPFYAEQYPQYRELHDSLEAMLQSQEF